MTTDQINIAVAKLCGWTDIESDKLHPTGWLKVWPFPISERKPQCSNAKGHLAELPNYAGDSNAAREAVLQCCKASFDQFLFGDTLRKIVTTGHRTIARTAYCAATAKPAQICESLLRTFNLWEDQ